MHAGALGLLRALPDSGGVCALVLDSRLRVVAASRGCVSLFGRRTGVLVGLPADRLVSGLSEEPPPRGEACLDVTLQRLTGPAPARLCWYRRGKSVVAILMASPARSADLGIPGVGKLVSMLGHEVRNPLSSVKLVVQTLVREEGLDERALRRLAIAGREIRTIEHIVSALTELVDDAEPSPEPADPRSLLASAVDLVASDLKARRVEVAMDADADLPELEVDRSRVTRALGYLLLNCARATEGGTVALRASRSPDGVRFTVKELGTQGEMRPGARLFTLLAEQVARHHGGAYALASGPSGTYYVLELPTSELPAPLPSRPGPRAGRRGRAV